MRLRDIPLPIKIVLTICIFPVFGIIWIVASSMEMERVLKNARFYPNEQTVTQLLETFNRVKLGVANHPENWKKLRETWYAINGSNRVPTYLKEMVIMKFTKLGLYISNTKVIDNYIKK